MLRELTFILSNFIMSIKIPSSQKASDFQHENHDPPSGPFTFLARAGVSLVAPHLHLPLPAGPRPPARRWGSPAAAAFQVSPGNNSGGALQGNNSCIIYATSCFWEVDFFQMGIWCSLGECACDEASSAVSMGLLTLLCLRRTSSYTWYQVLFFYCAFFFFFLEKFFLK